MLEVTVMFTANPEKDLVGIGALYAFIDRKMVAGEVAAVECEATHFVPFNKFVVHLAIPYLPLYDTGAKYTLVTRVQSVHAVMGLKTQAM